MELTLSAKKFTLRCDLLALRDAHREGGVDIGNLGEDIVSLGTLAFYLARSGAKFAGIPFEYKLDAFLALCTFTELPELTTAIAHCLGDLDGDAKKKEAAKL